jgi:pimeloyl-ACP methyl ester carboxylesterase
MVRGMASIEPGRVVANGLDVAYLSCDAGRRDAPLALCLHGFPDSAHSWRHLLPRLAEAGFRAVAPFQRGYAPTGVPADGRYQSGVLSLDAIALHDALGGDERAVLVGHDWGAPAAYGAASHAPDRWAKVVGIAVPPGGALATAILTDRRQLKRSWYMFVFLHPLADLAVSHDDLAFVDGLWEDWSPGYDAAEDLALLKPALRDPANLAAALGYYRAALNGTGVDPDLAAVQAATATIPSQPLLYLHGAEDGCIGAEVAEAAGADLPPTARVEIVERCGHFLHLEQPAGVNRRIVEHLTA